MRTQFSLRAAATVACAALLVGVTGPAIAAEHVSRPAGKHAVVPAADTLTKQTKALGGAGKVVAPVTTLVNTVLKGEHGKVSAQHLRSLRQSVHKAVAEAKKAAPAAPRPQKGTTAAAAPTDAVDDALTAVLKAVDALVAAVLTGDMSDLGTQLSDALGSLVDVIVATAQDTDLPASSLAGLAQLPADTSTATAPAGSAVPSGTVHTLPAFS